MGSFSLTSLATIKPNFSLFLPKKVASITAIISLPSFS